MNKLLLLKDQKDLIYHSDKEDIINILGTKGSGKTTLSIPYIEDDNYIVVNCDRLLELPSEEKEDKELSNIRNLLKKKYKTIPEGKDFSNCYKDIIDYIKSKKKKALIEGNIIQEIDPSTLQGKVIIKRTSLMKSFMRAIKRDYKNQYFLDLEKKKHKYLYKVTRLYKIAKRRTSVFKQRKEIEKIINYFEKTI